MISRSAGNSADFMDSGREFERKAFTDKERTELLDWYRTEHGLEDLSLVSYVPFLIDHLPGDYKRMRQYAQATMTGWYGGGLPVLAYAFFAVYSYAAIEFAATWTSSPRSSRAGSSASSAGLPSLTGSRPRPD